MEAKHEERADGDSSRADVLVPVADRCVRSAIKQT
jgi:hypothetical protein